jgi:hypothetical protein
MQFNLHSQYAKAVAPRPEAHALASARARRAQPPPGPLRSGAARALASTARRLDGDAARRAIA